MLASRLLTLYIFDIFSFTDFSIKSDDLMNFAARRIDELAVSQSDASEFWHAFIYFCSYLEEGGRSY